MTSVVSLMRLKKRRSIRSGEGAEGDDDDPRMMACRFFRTSAASRQEECVPWIPDMDPDFDLVESKGQVPERKENRWG